MQDILKLDLYAIHCICTYECFVPPLSDSGSSDLSLSYYEHNWEGLFDCLERNKSSI